MIEILIIHLKPGTKEQFHHLYVTEALPLLKKWKFQMLGYGPTLHDEDSYYVIRSFKSLEDRVNAEEAYYSSDDWQKGPRGAIFALAENFSTTVVSKETWLGWINSLKE